MELTKKTLLAKILNDKGIIALITTSIENNYYVSGFYPFSKKLNPQVSVFSVFITKKNIVKCVLPAIDLPSAFENKIKEKDVSSYGSFRFNDYSPTDDIAKKVEKKILSIHSTCTDALAEILTNEGLTEGLIALEYRGLTGNELTIINESFPRIKFIDGTSIIDQLREVKTDEEITFLSKASSIAESSLLYTFENMKIGMSELETSQIYQKRVIDQGGDNTFSVFTFSSRAAFSDTVPSTSNRLNNGDMIRADVGCSYFGYHADMSRSAVMGKCDDQVKSVYKAILSGLTEAINVSKSGVKCSDIFNMAVSSTRKAGLLSYNRHHCGHGIGLFIHEGPLISSNNKAQLQDGMVICIETPFYHLGWGGLQVEDTILIRDEGNILLTNSPRKLLCL